jgi:hypothetical protein
MASGRAAVCLLAGQLPLQVHMYLRITSLVAFMQRCTT